MNSSANDTFDPTHSSDSDSDGNPGVSSDYVDRSSASSLNATLLVDTQTLATPATSDKIVSDSLQHFFPMSMVADLTKHLFTLGPEAIEEIAAILQVTVAPSTTTQSTAQSKFLTAYENADAITKSLFNRGIARTDPSGGGIALIFPAAQRPPSGPTPATRTTFQPGADVSPHGSLVLAPCIHEHTVVGLATKARALLPDLPPFPSSARQASVPTADVVTLLNSIGSHLRDGKVVFAPPMEGALKLIFFVADNFPELILGPVEAVKAELFRAVTLLKLPPCVHGSLVYAVAKEVMRRLEDEVIGHLRLSMHLPEIILERLRLLDDGHVPNAAHSISGLIAKPHELWKFADSLTVRNDKSQANAMLNFRAVRDAGAGDPEVVGGPVQCYNRYCEKLETAVYKCTRFGVTPSLDQDAHEIALRFITSMDYKDKYKQKALKDVVKQFGKAVFTLESPLPEHDYRAVQACARRAVEKIDSMADKLRSRSAADESQGAGRNMQPSSNRANVANSTGTQNTPGTSLRPHHGLNFPARQAARGTCFNCGSKEHMFRDCDSDTQRCPLCLSTDHHCNQCPKLTTKALQKNA